MLIGFAIVLVLLMALRLVSMVFPENSHVGKTEATNIWFDDLLLPLITTESLLLLDRKTLDASLKLGTEFLLNNQKSEGNFTYEYDFVSKTFSPNDNQVRQAGALWGISLIHRDSSIQKTPKAIEKGLSFFKAHSKETQNGNRYVLYPEASSGSTGTVALVALALVEWLHSDSMLKQRKRYEKDLHQYIAFLLSIRTNTGQFYSRYRLEDGAGYEDASPYYDGETLLALVKAAKYTGYENLQASILESAEAMYQDYIVKALAKNPDSAITKGFFQWGIMAFYELYTSGWPGTRVYAERAIELADWMIDVHQTLRRAKNTAYAQEGLITAWELARLSHRWDDMEKIGQAIDQGLYKLTSWQVGGPLQNDFLKAHPTDDSKARGGIMNAPDDANLRIDVTQHQMHAVILARNFVYRNQTVSSISSQDLSSLVDYAAFALQNPKQTPPRLPTTIQNDALPRIVFLSASDGQSAAKVVTGKALGLQRSVDNALQQLLSATWSRPPRWVKLDIVSHVYPVETINPDEALNGERSLLGIAFENEENLAFLPEELVTATLVDSQQRLRPKNINNYLKRRLPGTDTPFDEGSPLRVSRFRTLSFFSDGKDSFSLYRGHRQVQVVTESSLLENATAASQYLIRSMNGNGRFVYSYLPKSDREKEDYNILRHAGTTFSLLQLYKTTGEVAYLDAARKAIQYLMTFVRPCSLDQLTLSCVVEGGHVKLGGNALALVALTKYVDLTNEQRYLPTLRNLGEWIVRSQGKDGRFNIHKQSQPEGATNDFVSSYYPGEAILALTRLYAIDPDPRWLDAAQRAAQYLIAVRDGNKSIDQLEHDHWLLYGLNALYRQRPNPMYLDHTLKIVQAIQRAQHRSVYYADWLGGYYRPPRTTPTATRSEGLWAAYQLLSKNGYEKESKAVFEALSLGVRFVLKNQFQPESALYLKDPQRVLGGFRQHLTNFEIRIDYVQHALSAMLGFYQILKSI